VFIEPSYDVLHDYRAGNSQHPLGDVRRGEALIKSTYEAIRNSPHWSTSMLIVVWDEHGGFYDHAPVPAAVSPGDTKPLQDSIRRASRSISMAPVCRRW
jgi:phospholipase C